ncbi:hypothetical protein DFH07DRAFT_697810, partial [Mycena maculata]
NHYAGFSHSVSVPLLHGDSMGFPPPLDALPIEQWLFSDLPSTAISLPPTEITPGQIGQQRVNAGSGSCFIAAQNFLESIADSTLLRWVQERAMEFWDKALRELILYHLIA